jgi:hypothetical protein
MNGDSRKDSGFQACPFCDKMVELDKERHTLYDCRNFLLKQFYREGSPDKRRKLERKIEEVNAKLGTKSKNLVDT